MSLNAITKRAEDVIEATQRQFGDEAGVQITRTDIIRWINEVQLEILSRNRVLKARAVADVEKGKAEYELPAVDIFQIESIRLQDTFLQNINVQEAERTIMNMSDRETKRSGVWWEWAGVINLWPTPGEDIPDGLVVYYTKNPKEVVMDSDLLSLPDKYYNRILDGVLEKAYQLDENYEAAAHVGQNMTMKLEEMSEEERMSQHMTYPKITIVE